MLNTYPRNIEAHPQEYEYCIPTVEPCNMTDTYVFKIIVFTKQAKYEFNTVFFSSLCVFNT